MYRSTRKSGPRLQERHQRVSELLQETMSIKDAAARYGVSPFTLREALRSCASWEAEGRTPRYYIADIERMVGEIRGRMGQG